LSRIHLSGPDVRGGDREAVLAAIDSGWIAPVGPDLDAFERELAAVTGRAIGVGLASGTAAIHLGLKELGVGPGDEVVVSTFTFAGSAFPIAHCGATPVLVDSEAATWNLSPDLLAEELEARDAQGRPQPKAAVVVDLYGQCADYDRIEPILASRGIPLLEDAAEAIGATYHGRPAGSFGACAVLSFNGNKLVTTSGGGALVCDDPELARRCRFLATQAREPAPHYEHDEIGYNYRLSNLLAALGRAQLATLAERIDRRREIRQRYEKVLADQAGVGFHPVGKGHAPNHWLTCITVDPAVAGFSADELRLHLEAADIESRPTWKPMHLQPVFADAPRRVDGTAQRLFDHGLCLPTGSGMSDDDLDRVAEAIEGFVQLRC